MKPTHTIVLDAGPIIKNEPSVSSLLAQSERLVTTPTVLSEIRDAVTWARIETMLVPFLTLRVPKAESYQIVANFAKKTGDFAVLSKADLEIIALAYDVECERNGGNWRLRNTPGQKQTNGTNPNNAVSALKDSVEATVSISDPPKLDTEKTSLEEPLDTLGEHLPVDTPLQMHEKPGQDQGASVVDPSAGGCEADSTLTSDDTAKDVEAKLGVLVISGEKAPMKIRETPKKELLEKNLPLEGEEGEENPGDISEESDAEGWITPSNLKKHQERDAAGPSIADQIVTESTIMQVATISTDFALQNVLLQMNLNLLSTSLHRVRHLKTFVLRCHACFNISKDMSKQFCPRCGKPTLTRVSCSTNQNGEFKIHLKKNFQWNNRGDRYSIPKPTAGSANGKQTGGGKGGWGNELILAEDQKEYERAIASEKRRKNKDLMDEDFIPNILSGSRANKEGKPRIGAGRNVNSRKRHA